MSGLRGVILKLMPARWRAAAEAESRRWICTCLTCGAERSLWDHGGLRFKAAGNPRTRLRCAVCGQSRWHRLAYATAPGPGGGTSPRDTGAPPG